METAPWQLRRAALPVPTTDRNPEIGGDPGPHILPPIRQFGCRPADGLRIVEHVARTELDLVPVGSFDRIPAPLDEVLTACGYLKAAGNGRRPRMYSEVEAGRSATVCVGVRANAKGDEADLPGAQEHHREVEETTQGMACCQGAVRDPVRRPIRADRLTMKTAQHTESLTGPQAPARKNPDADEEATR